MYTSSDVGWCNSTVTVFGSTEAKIDFKVVPLGPETWSCSFDGTDKVALVKLAANSLNLFKASSTFLNVESGSLTSSKSSASSLGC